MFKVDSTCIFWGIKVSNVEIKHIDLDESMIRAIAKQAEGFVSVQIVACKQNFEKGWYYYCYINIVA